MFFECQIQKSYLHHSKRWIPTVTRGLPAPCSVWGELSGGHWEWRGFVWDVQGCREGYCERVSVSGFTSGVRREGSSSEASSTWGFTRGFSVYKQDLGILRRNTLHNNYKANSISSCFPPSHSPQHSVHFSWLSVLPFRPVKATHNHGLG